ARRPRVRRAVLRARAGARPARAAPRGRGDRAPGRRRGAARARGAQRRRGHPRPLPGVRRHPAAPGDPDRHRARRPRAGPGGAALRRARPRTGVPRLMSQDTSRNTSRERVRRIVVDTDTGIDDAHTLLYLAGRPDAELVAITSVYGNCAEEDAARNIGY